MSNPNIRTAKEAHSAYCWRQEWYGGAPKQHKLGDVRYCGHGKVQVLTEPTYRSPVAGPGAWFWLTLSPILDPIRYRRAKRALNGL